MNSLSAPTVLSEFIKLLESMHFQMNSLSVPIALSECIFQGWTLIPLLRYLWLSEAESLSQGNLENFVEESGAKYAILYVSDPSRSIQYPSYRDLQRFLAESTAGNESTNSTICDEVCQIKSSLLEGILVVNFLVHFYKCSSSMTCELSCFLIPFFFCFLDE